MAKSKKKSKKDIKCPNCKGTGKIVTEATPPVGGYDPNYAPDPDQAYQNIETCHECGGKGTKRDILG